jgi:hypothetical protein
LINGWEGYFDITINGQTERIKNRVMNAAINQLADVFTGASPNLEIKWLAVGTSSTAVTDADTQLGNEIFRTQATVSPTRVATGQIETEFTILESEAIGTLREIGVFGGNATSAKDSGTLISRIIWNKEKTVNEEMTIKRIDVIRRV